MGEFTAYQQSGYLQVFEIHNISFTNTGFFCVCVAFLSMAYLLHFG